MARGLTLREVAEKAGMSFQLLGQIERDGQATTTEKLLSLIGALGGRLLVVDGDAVGPTPVLSPERADIARSFLDVLPHIPDEELEVFSYEVALWQRRYKPK